MRDVDIFCSGCQNCLIKLLEIAMIRQHKSFVDPIASARTAKGHPAAADCYAERFEPPEPGRTQSAHGCHNNGSGQFLQGADLGNSVPWKMNPRAAQRIVNICNRPMEVYIADRSIQVTQNILGFPE